MVCPHAVIRPVCLNEEEVKNAPEGTQLVKHKKTDYQYAIIVSTLDCTGCGSCANACPTKSLTMKPIASQLKSQPVYDALSQIDAKPEVLTNNTIGVQYRKPYLEFSGACAGCGETPYAKLATQLYGDRMYIANATGCSSIWGGSAPSTPYTVDKKGHGPAWSNSLFEDNAEFGYGMMLAQKQIRERLAMMHRFFLILLLQIRFRLGLILMMMPLLIQKQVMLLLPLLKIQSLMVKLMMLK